MLIWQDPSYTLAGQVAGLKLNISTNIGATPGAGDYTAFQSRTTNDLDISVGLWGEDIIVQQGTQPYYGNASLVVVGGVGTLTTQSPHMIQCPAAESPQTCQGTSFVFAGMGNSALDSLIFGPISITSPTVLTVNGNLSTYGIPDGTYPSSGWGTMSVNTFVRGEELEVQCGSQLSGANAAATPYSGSGVRCNGLEIAGIATSGPLTAGIMIFSNNVSSSSWWTYGLAMTQVANIGIWFEQTVGQANQFSVAAIEDDSNSASVLKLTGTHNTFIDFSTGTGPVFTQFFEGPNAGATLRWNYINAFSLYTTADQTLDGLIVSNPENNTSIQMLPDVSAAAFDTIVNAGDSVLLGTTSVIGNGVLDLIVQSSNSLGIKIDGPNDLLHLYGPLAAPNLPTSAGSGGLYICVDTTGKEYKKSSCP